MKSFGRNRHFRSRKTCSILKKIHVDPNFVRVEDEPAGIRNQALGQERLQTVWKLSVEEEVEHWY